MTMQSVDFVTELLGIVYLIYVTVKLYMQGNIVCAFLTRQQCGRGVHMHR